MSFGCISHYETNKTFYSWIIFSSRCNVIRGPGNCLIYGQRRASCPWQRGMCKPGLPSVWDPAWKSFTSSDECGTVHTLKELAVVSAWHCPRYNLLKVHLCCSRVALWPLCSFRPLKASSLFCCSRLPGTVSGHCGIWTVYLEEVAYLGRYEVIYKYSPSPSNQCLT